MFLSQTSGWLNLAANVIDNFTHGLAVAGSFCVSTKVGLYGRHNGPIGSNGNIRQCQLAHSRRCIRLLQVARRCASACRSWSV